MLKQSKKMIEGKEENSIKEKCEESAVKVNKVEIAYRMEEVRERSQWWKLIKSHRKQCCKD